MIFSPLIVKNPASVSKLNYKANGERNYHMHSYLSQKERSSLGRRVERFLGNVIYLKVNVFLLVVTSIELRAASAYIKL